MATRTPAKIAIVVINYQKTTATLHCLDALYAASDLSFALYLIDNAATPESASILENDLNRRGNARLLLNASNRGFAGACNQAIAAILDSMPDCQAVVLLNNDAIVERGWLERMWAALDPAAGFDMVAARMMSLTMPAHVDSLGIVLYKSGIASNRKSLDEPLLGPCGGAALYSIRLLQEVRTCFGEIFDERFFCYAEDTDLAIRANALGYRCAMADEAVVHHWGSLSSGGASNEFVAYHGLRNSLFVLLKNMPVGWLLRHSGWIALMQCAVVGQYLLKGHYRLIWRIYRDFFRDWKFMQAKRTRMCEVRARRPGSGALPVSRRFYDPSYLRTALRTLFARDSFPRAASHWPDRE